MFRMHDDYELEDDRERIDFGRVQAWLATAYWSPGRTREEVERCAAGSSLLVGAYRHQQQVGYLRVVSDQATFAWVCDVFVDEAHRHKGLARAMVQFALKHPGHHDVRLWLLATRGAEGVYQPLGFAALPEAQSTFMSLRR